MSKELAIVKRESVDMIVSAAPTAYADNQVSHQRCLQAGEAILDAIQRQGMNDELDQQAAQYIEKARRTIKKMYEKRSPVTKLFDEIRTTFTSLEGDIDPTRKDTVPQRLQQLRNEYAARKRREEEERRRAVMIEQQRQAAIVKYRTDLEEHYRRVFNGVLNKAINALMSMQASITLDNFAQSRAGIEQFPTTLTSDPFLRPVVYLPTNVSAEELAEVRQSVLSRLLPTFASQYEQQVAAARQEILTVLPSKEAELRRAAQASREEAERIAQQMRQREAEEAALREKQRLEQQRREEAEMDMKKQQAEVGSLFAGTVAASGAYQPKVDVKRKIQLRSPEGIMPVLALWFAREGIRMTPEELTKKFRFAVTFCEKLANKEGETIADDNVEYVEEVKAK